MPRMPWPDLPPTIERFREPPREYGILPFWFLNGELNPGEMRFQLQELREKGMPGIILHGRFGLELTYLGDEFKDRIKLAVEEGERLGLTTWIYDEMNWPSGTADFRVVKERPDLSQHYLECLSFPIRGPWFACLTGGDSRYIDFERSTPVAAFALSEAGKVVDLTPFLSFENVVPWQVPPGNWRIMYMVEKRAEYYIDALDPESTAEFLRLGYDPYAETLKGKLPSPTVGFYTDEPAMHYYVTAGDNAIVPWTKEMFRRFHERNGYNLRPRLPDLFFEVNPDSTRVRHDFYTTLTEFYSDAYFRQIHEWCQERDVLFTGHLLYEEWLRQMIRVPGNPFSHYRHLDVMGVDHLYPIIGSRDRPAEHVAMKLASSAAHQFGSDRLLCESFGSIFMDATMQRMKWLTDWQYVLGVNLLNPHGFHYTLEGPRKRDWPPSMFYQFPWWHFYGEFSAYVARLSHLLTGGRHVAKVALLWPMNSMFGSYTPQARTPLANRTEFDFNTLTDTLLRIHHDFDYLDESVLAAAEIGDGTIRVRDEVYELLILPPMTHLTLPTVARLEQFVASGGKVLGTVFLPDQAFGEGALVDISDRIASLFGVDPKASQQEYPGKSGAETSFVDHPNGGRAAFFDSYAINRQVPARLQAMAGGVGIPEHPGFVVDSAGEEIHYRFGEEEITGEVVAEREAVAAALAEAIGGLIAPDVTVDNPEIFVLHRVKDGRHLWFFVNSTSTSQSATVTVSETVVPVLWDPSTGRERPIAPSRVVDGRTEFQIDLSPVGSAFVTTAAEGSARVVATNAIVDRVTGGSIVARVRGGEASVTVDDAGRDTQLTSNGGAAAEPLVLDGDWTLTAEDANGLVIKRWLATPEAPGSSEHAYAAPEIDASGWLPVTMGAWSYQLPAEPTTPYPIPVWYRIAFEVEAVPPSLDLIIDGFAGEDRQVFLNGVAVEAVPVRSAIDAQMRALSLVDQVREGSNVLTVRLTLTRPTDGILDLIKLTGDFAVAGNDDDERIAAAQEAIQAASWTAQGFPYYSGSGVYRTTFGLPQDFAGQRVHLEAALVDDAVEVLVNGASAGVILWEPYEIDVTDLLRPGENTLELRVANTPINLIEGVRRPSGLSGPPRLIPYREIRFEIPSKYT